MKKTFLALAAGIITALTAHAQNKKMNLGADKLKAFQTSETVSEFSGADNKYLVNLKALRDFTKTYKTVTNENWYIVQDGFIAKFKKNNIQNRVDYDKKGNWLTTFRYYGEDQLPREVRHLVKSTYYDYAITLVNEIKTGSKTIYIVHMADKTSWVNLRVCDGEMEVAEQLDKSY
ncbi:MAG: hypothetical protein HC867_01950 [Bacteroidia bacterium]|nr:hypothetical protein [Bacteroidia bacterium]